METQDEGFVQSCRRHSLLVEILSILLGINSLIATNGLWVELPLMVPILPEGWQLPAYLTIIIQIANIGPLVYALARYLRPESVTEKRAIYVMLAIGLFSTACMVFFWQRTLWIAGQPRSVALFALTFFLALVDSTSSIVCLPFMSRLKDFYVTFYMIGEGLGGFLPSIVAIAQGVEEYTECVNATVWNATVWNATANSTEQVSMVPRPTEPLFSAEVFFAFLFGMMLVSSVGFFLLNCLPAAKRQHVDRRRLASASAKNETSVELQSFKDSEDSFQNETIHFRKHVNSDQYDYDPPITPQGEAEEKFWLSMGTYTLKSEVDDVLYNGRGSFQNIPAPKKRAPRASESDGKVNNSKTSYYTLLLMQLWVSALGYGVFPSVQSYSCLPYGSETYLLTVIMVSTATPVASIVALLLPTRKVSVVVLLTFCGTVVSAYAMMTAVMSPEPILVDTTLGKILVAACWVVFTSMFGYVKVSIAALLRSYGHGALFWCGAVTQLGSASAATSMFLLVSVWELFHERKPC